MYYILVLNFIIVHAQKRAELAVMGLPLTQEVAAMGTIEISPSNTHILAFPFPAKGHINPLLHLCKRLASKGFMITFITTASTFKDVKTKATGLINIESIPDGIDLEDDSMKDVEAYFTKFRTSAVQNMIEFMEKQMKKDYPPKVLIYDSMMPWILDVVQRVGLLGARFFTQPCYVNAVYYHMFQGTLKKPLEEPTVSLPCLPLLESKDLPGFDFFKEHSEYVAKFHGEQFLDMDKVDYILFNTFYELEVEVANWMASKWPILTVGPTASLMLLDNNDKGGNYLFETNTEFCLKWLDEREPDSVIYVSFGSIASLTEEQMEEVAQGLMRSNCNFLWVVRDEEEGKLPKDFKSETSEKGLIINWCPQLDVLAHRAVGCFMTHCGWNSTLEALCSGVPMIAVPQFVDQPTNAKFIEDYWEVGVRVKVNENDILTREEIERCIREVTETERAKELRRNAMKWKELAMKAVSEGGSSDRNIEDFASKLLYC